MSNGCLVFSIEDAAAACRLTLHVILFCWYHLVPEYLHADCASRAQEHFEFINMFRTEYFTILQEVTIFTLLQY